MYNYQKFQTFYLAAPLKAYSMISYRGRSQNCQNVSFLYLSVVLL